MEGLYVNGYACCEDSQLCVREKHSGSIQMVLCIIMNCLYEDCDQYSLLSINLSKFEVA